MKPGVKKGTIIPFYKGKYMLALYDTEDNLVQVFDNCHQAAKWMDTTYDSMASSIGRVISGYNDYLLNKGKKYKIFAYEVEENEKKELIQDNK